MKATALRCLPYAPRDQGKALAGVLHGEQAYPAFSRKALRRSRATYFLLLPPFALSLATSADPLCARVGVEAAVAVSLPLTAPTS